MDYLPVRFRFGANSVIDALLEKIGSIIEKSFGGRHRWQIDHTIYLDVLPSVKIGQRPSSQNHDSAIPGLPLVGLAPNLRHFQSGRGAPGRPILRLVDANGRGFQQSSSQTDQRGLSPEQASQVVGRKDRGSNGIIGPTRAYDEQAQQNLTRPAPG